MGTRLSCGLTNQAWPRQWLGVCAPYNWCALRSWEPQQTRQCGEDWQLHIQAVLRMQVPNSPGWKHPQDGHCEVAPGPAESARSYKGVSAKASERAKAFTAHRDLQCCVTGIGVYWTQTKGILQRERSNSVLQDQSPYFYLWSTRFLPQTSDGTAGGSWQKCLYHLFFNKKNKNHWWPLISYS